MRARGEGLTSTYNRFHRPAEQSADIAELRRLHATMDHAVAAAYGWQDLALDHGFHETKQGLRYTIGAAARRTVLDRLLALNHQRYAAEVAAGLHDAGAKKAKGAKKVRAARVAADAGARPASMTQRRARVVYHGQRGEMRHRYREGQEDQRGALGLVVNAIVLWNTIYMDRALAQLRAEGQTLAAADVARLSPLGNDHLNVLGRYSFALPPAIQGGAWRAFRSQERGQ